MKKEEGGERVGMEWKNGIGKARHSVRGRDNGKMK